MMRVILKLLAIHSDIDLPMHHIMLHRHNASVRGNNGLDYLDLTAQEGSERTFRYNDAAAFSLVFDHCPRPLFLMVQNARDTRSESKPTFAAIW